jgi:hypothetical protein
MELHGYGQGDGWEGLVLVLAEKTTGARQRL